MNSLHTGIAVQRKFSVAVLMATYNGESYLSEQLCSIDKQEDVDIQIFLRDDLSTDQTLFIASKYRSDRIHFINILQNDERSGSAAGNFLNLFRQISINSYDYVAISDQDDIWMSKKLSNAISIMRREVAGAYSSNTLAFWPNKKPIKIRKNYPQKKFDWLFESASQGCTYVVDAKIFAQFQNWLDANWALAKHVYHHDWLFYAWVRRNEVHWVMDDAATTLYRQTDANAWGANVGLKALAKRIRLATAGWLLNEAIGLARLLDERLIFDRLQRWNLSDRLWFAAHAYQMRRRPRDVLLFGLMCLSVGRGGMRR